jgi:hypothetical protein
MPPQQFEAFLALVNPFLLDQEGQGDNANDKRPFFAGYLCDLRGCTRSGPSAKPGYNKDNITRLELGSDLIPDADHRISRFPGITVPPSPQKPVPEKDLPVSMCETEIFPVGV